jgi:capsid portal protein
MKKITTAAVLATSIMLLCFETGAETKKEYENRLQLMFDFAVRTNEYVRQRLGDKGLASYAHAMAERNAKEAERMTPPAQYTLLHPHFLLVLENIERSFFFVEKGDMSQYRHHQKEMRKEIQILESLADQARLDLYPWGRGQ